MPLLFKEQIRRLFPKIRLPYFILSGPLRGARLVTSLHDYPAAILGYTERALLEWIGRNVKPGEVWLDVGAHYGVTSIALGRAVGPTGKVFAFEPNLGSAGCLFRTARLNKLEHLLICPMALGNTPRLALQTMPAVRGMIDPNYAPSITRETASFFSVSLDSWWFGLPENNQMMHGVKIDVQGGEIAVLEGMLNCLKRFRPLIIVEIHVGVSRQRILELLAECNYATTPVAIESEAHDFWQEVDDKSYLFRPLTQ